MPKHERLSTTLFALLISLALILSACGAPAGQPSSQALAPAEAAPTEAAPTEAAAEKIIFRGTIPFFQQDWSPLRGGGWSMQYLAFWNAGPMYFDENSELQPLVFNTWTPNDDNSVWTFTIDPEAVFSDGSPITA